jgi:aryl-alcohol dehydrogenase-like predicted oxidoreductase
LFSRPVELDGKRLEPLFQAMDAVAQAHGKTLAQVAVNWLLTNPEVSVIPIPGMKSPRQVADNAGALGWAMTAPERDLIDAATACLR